MTKHEKILKIILAMIICANISVLVYNLGKSYGRGKTYTRLTFEPKHKKIKKAAETIERSVKGIEDACPIDKPCEKSTVEHDQSALNDKAKKQYEEYLAADRWTCPKCGRQYHWNVNEAGRYAVCPKCQLASKDDKKA